MIYKINNLLLIGAAIFIASACSSTSMQTTRSFGSPYHPASSPLHPKYDVFHHQEDRSQLLGKIFPVELMFNQANPTGEILAQVQVKVIVNEIIEGQIAKDITDSTTFRYMIPQGEASKRFMVKEELKMPFGKKYQLMVLTTDLLRNVTSTDVLTIDKTSKYTQQNYNLEQFRTQSTLFAPFVVGKSPFTVEYAWPADSFYVFYYKGLNSLPPPVFSPERTFTMPPRHDSLWVFKNTPGTPFQLEHKGVYIFQVQPNIGEGLTVMNFDASFPRINNEEELLEPLIYITTTSEYNELKNSPNLKLAIDNFWLERTKSIEKAREIIRVYYNRVYYSNYYFTSFKEGWKTDMGMVYVIYGPPNRVNSSFGEESWVYYDKNLSSPVTFTFKRNDNKFSNNHFVLDRSQSYNISWRKAVDSWRNGEIFMLQ